MSSLEKMKAYQRKRNWLALYGIVLSLLIFLGAIVFRFTFTFSDWAYQMNASMYGNLFFYFLFFTLYSTAISVPLSFYSGFILEHQYELSN